MPEKQQLKWAVVLPEGLNREQIARLKEVFTADLVATLGGEEFLKEKNIAVEPPFEITASPVILS